MRDFSFNDLMIKNDLMIQATQAGLLSSLSRLA